MNANLMRRVAGSVRSRGLAGTARLAAARLRGRLEDWSERSFDRRYGTDTGGAGTPAPDGFPGRPYEPVTPAMFRRMIRAARIAPRDFVFVDYGCGKGRALLLAAQLGFRRSIGVELQPALYHVAVSNARAFRRACPGAGPIEVILGDATRFCPPGSEDVVLFFYNPFGEPLMEKTRITIESVCGPGQRCIVAYRNPVHAAVFERSPRFRPLARNRSFALYSLY